MKSLDGLIVEGNKFNEELDTLDGHITRSAKSMDNVKNRYTKLFGKIEKMHEIEGVQTDSEAKLLES